MEDQIKMFYKDVLVHVHGKIFEAKNMANIAYDVMKNWVDEGEQKFLKELVEELSDMELRVFRKITSI